MRLAIALDDRLAGVRGGARIGAAVTTSDGGAAAGVDAWLELRELAGGAQHVARRTHPVPLHAGPLPPGHRLRVALRLPRDAPPTLATAWGSLHWFLVVRVARPGGTDLRAEVELEVAG